jgi:hypothetical protein
MALTATNLSAEPRAWSVGPLKVQLITFSVANGDTSGTITCDKLSSVVFAHVSGITQTAAPTFSTNVITLAFVDPTATRHGQCIAFGR